MKFYLGVVTLFLFSTFSCLGTTTTSPPPVLIGSYPAQAQVLNITKVNADSVAFFTLWFNQALNPASVNSNTIQMAYQYPGSKGQTWEIIPTQATFNPYNNTVVIVPLVPVGLKPALPDLANFDPNSVNPNSIGYVIALYGTVNGQPGLRNTSGVTLPPTTPISFGITGGLNMPGGACPVTISILPGAKNSVTAVNTQNPYQDATGNCSQPEFDVAISANDLTSGLGDPNAPVIPTVLGFDQAYRINSSFLSNPNAVTMVYYNQEGPGPLPAGHNFNNDSTTPIAVSPLYEDRTPSVGMAINQALSPGHYQLRLTGLQTLTGLSYQQPFTINIRLYGAKAQQATPSTSAFNLNWAWPMGNLVSGMQSFFNPNGPSLPEGGDEPIVPVCSQGSGNPNYFSSLPRAIQPPVCGQGNQLTNQTASPPPECISANGTSQPNGVTGMFQVNFNGILEPGTDVSGNPSFGFNQPVADPNTVNSKTVQLWKYSPTGSLTQVPNLQVAYNPQLYNVTTAPRGGITPGHYLLSLSPSIHNQAGQSLGNLYYQYWYGGAMETIGLSPSDMNYLLPDRPNFKLVFNGFPGPMVVSLLKPDGDDPTSINASTVQVFSGASCSGTPLPINVSYNRTLGEIIVVPTTLNTLTTGGTYTLMVNGLQDRLGTGQTRPWSYTFTNP